MNRFVLHSPYQATGDQPKAIDQLARGLEAGDRFQTLKGVTGSGKTFTMANIIERVQRPTLVLAHNKTLASQLCSEFREFFPENAVEYFVSYYDYYQPEAYVPATDSYIAKDASINDEIDKLRNSATAALMEREDVIIVASVSCIYGLGDPGDYDQMSISLRPGMTIDRDELLRQLVAIQYIRNDMNFIRGTFRVRGDTVDIFPVASSSTAIRLEFFGDELDQILEIDNLTGQILCGRKYVTIFPATLYGTSPEKIDRALVTIRQELDQRLEELQSQHKLVEAQRLEQRTLYDMEMLKEVGYCSGIENYTRHLTARPAGSKPYTLLDYFPDHWMAMIDESHETLPQLHGMYNGNKARKETLIDYGFRLPSAMDNRPLTFDEFMDMVPQAVFVSATPGPFEERYSSQIVEQLIRPTGLLDPRVEVRPTKNQMDNLLGEIRATIQKGERVLVTTLTKKMAEDLTKYLEDLDIKVTYLHSDVDTMERMEIIRDLRLGVYDVLVGINLLREGLDIPEVSLIAILDADKEGFLRSETSLIQTIGRAARNVDGHVILYGDTVTASMQGAMDETNRRRSIQQAYNEEHGIEPRSIVKEVREVLTTGIAADEVEKYRTKNRKRNRKRNGGRGSQILHPLPEDYFDSDGGEETGEIPQALSRQDMKKILANMEVEMKQAAEELDFERAALIRDKIRELSRLV